MQLRLEWVIGQDTWNSVYFGISRALDYYDLECHDSAFKRSPCMDAMHGTDYVTT